MEVSSYSPGTPCWADVMVPDTAAAAVFYGSLFDWHVPPGDPTFGGYASAELRGLAVAGVMPKMAPDMPTVWSAYIAVADAAATLEAASEAGAAVIVPASEVGSLGTMGVFADPQGAVLGIWQPGDHLGARRIHEPGAMHWLELSTSDVDAARPFYAAVFGWEAVAWGDGVDYTLWSVDGVPVAGMMPLGEDRADIPPHWLVYFAVADCDEAAGTATALGGQVLAGPFDAPGVGRLAVLRDDQGAGFAVIAPAAVEAAA